MHPDARPGPRLPCTLSDQAAVEILEFLEQLIDLFEFEYAHQIERYYAKRSKANLIEPPSTNDDPPF